jgi:pyrimidine operon attenuation protein/uracil phosphoribosyltransferase
VGTLKTISSGEIRAAIERLASAIAARHPDRKRLLLLGIANGGMELARRLGAILEAPAGTLDISFHRDDIGRHPIPKEFAPTRIPQDVHGGTVILVDDVLFSGRTVKAALDELFDHGRPTKVELAILVDRGGHRLPFAPDYCGFTLATKESEKIHVILNPGDGRRDSVRIAPASQSVLAKSPA